MKNPKNKVEKNRLKKRIHRFLRIKKFKEAGLLINQYKSKFGEIE